MIFAYFGPETVLPLTSTLAAVAGVALMFGRQTFRVLATVVTGVSGRSSRGKAAPRPRRATLRPDAASTPRPSAHPTSAADRDLVDA